MVNAAAQGMKQDETAQFVMFALWKQCPTFVTMVLSIPRTAGTATVPLNSSKQNEMSTAAQHNEIPMLNGPFNSRHIYLKHERCWYIHHPKQSSIASSS